MSLGIRAAGLFAGALLASVSAHALSSERLAIELLGTETQWDGAFEYERACWRLGADGVRVRPVETFDADGGRFVRLHVQGDELALRCLDSLESPRRGVDGEMHWFDGFQGGAVVPDGPRVADTVWYHPDSVTPAARPDKTLVDALVRGDHEATARTLALSAPVAMAVIEALAARGGAAAVPVLEQLATTHPHWRARRAATELLDANLSFAVLARLSRDDVAWEVRHAAAGVAALAAAGALAQAAPRAQDAIELLGELLDGDAAWPVRRRAIWLLPSTGAATLSKKLLAHAGDDAAPQVRAAALETLAGIDLLPRARARAALEDPSVMVRAVAAHILAVLFDPDDAALLWRMMQQGPRPVRLAAAPMLSYVRTDGLGPRLWSMYLDEAREVNARADLLEVFADALALAGFAELGSLVEQRMAQPLSPQEKGLLARLLARVDRPRALAVLTPGLDAPEPLERAIAAHAVPDTPETRTRRIELLADESAQVRAGAVLGLCGVPGFSLSDQQQRSLDLIPTGLGRAALLAVSRCGQPEPEITRTSVSLDPVQAERDDGTAPALAALALIVLSVVGIKLRGARA